VVGNSGVVLPDGGHGHSLLDYRVRVENGEYERWSDSVPRMEIESHRVAATDVVITTTDTVRHSDVLSAFLGRRLPLVLCGKGAKLLSGTFWSRCISPHLLS
jgi:dynein heavy chain 1, cytosolic